MGCMARPKKDDAIDAKAYVGVRIRNDTRDALEQMASKRGVTLAEEIRSALEAHVERFIGKGRRK